MFTEASCDITDSNSLDLVHDVAVGTCQDMCAGNPLLACLGISQPGLVSANTTASLFTSIYIDTDWRLALLDTCECQGKE